MLEKHPIHSQNIWHNPLLAKSRVYKDKTFRGFEKAREDAARKARIEKEKLKKRQ